MSLSREKRIHKEICIYESTEALACYISDLSSKLQHQQYDGLEVTCLIGGKEFEYSRELTVEKEPQEENFRAGLSQTARANFDKLMATPGFSVLLPYAERPVGAQPLYKGTLIYKYEENAKQLVINNQDEAFESFKKQLRLHGLPLTTTATRPIYGPLGVGNRLFSPTASSTQSRSSSEPTAGKETNHPTLRH